MSSVGSWTRRRRRTGTRLLVAAVLVVLALVAGVVVDVALRPDPGRVLWDGGFDTGALPAGVNGRSCGTGRHVQPPSRRQGYGSIQEEGNTACTSTVTVTGSRVRTSDSRRSLRVEMGSHQQREQAQSTYSWTPDAKGSVDLWYGFSLYYASNWNDGGGLGKEVSATYWHTPIAWRMQGDNGSLNLSGDMNMDDSDGKSYKTFSRPHMILRRNTLQNRRHFYKDGKGLDKIDLGPIVTGRWMDFVCHIRWSTTATDALRECWRDGRFMGRSTTLNAVASRPHYLRVGPYQSTIIDHPRTWYFDNVRIGTSYEAVDPARTR